MTLESLTRNELNQVTVTISEPSGFPGSVWNTGELAFVTVTVNNTCGMLLRDVVATLYAYRGCIVSPLYIFNVPVFDGQEVWSELEAGESRLYGVRLRATAAGRAYLRVTLNAEVVPYAVRYYAAVREPIITPA